MLAARVQLGVQDYTWLQILTFINSVKALFGRKKE